MGKGDAFKKLPQPEMEATIALLDEDIGYEIGGKLWSLKEISTAAKDLAVDVTGCIQGLEWKGLTSCPELRSAPVPLATKRVSEPSPSTS